MSTSTLNIYIIGGFLLLNLIVGIWAGRGVKDLKDYAIGSRVYGSGILTITFLATYFGASNVIATQQSIILYGVIAILPAMTASIMLLYFSYIFSKKFSKFHDCFTLSDIMNKLYGSISGGVSSLMSLVYTLCCVAAQMVAIGQICDDFMGWDIRVTTIIGGLILVAYSSFGGVKAVTITDILQFLVFIIVIPLVSFKIIDQAGGLKYIITSIPSEKLQIFSHRKFGHYFLSYALWGILPFILANPANIQRFLMSKNSLQIRKMLLSSSLMITLVRTILAIICLSVLVINPEIVPKEGSGFTYAIKNCFPSSMLGVGAIAMLAVVISTVDSFLNAGSVIVSQSITKIFYKKTLSSSQELSVVRYVSIVIGFISIAIALSGYNMRQIYSFGSGFFAPIIMFPLFVGIWGLKTDSKSFLISAGCTIITFAFSRVYFGHDFQYLSLPITFLVNLISYFTAHILQNKGIVIRKNKYEEIHWVPTLDGIKTTFLKITTIHIRVNNFLLNQFYVYKPQYVALAFTVCFSYMFPYLSSKNQGGYLVEIIKLIGACFCVALMLKPLWNDFFIKRLHLIWHFILFYCLPFTNTLLFVINDGEPIYMLNLGLSIVLMSYFVDIKTFVLMNAIGGYLAYICAKELPGFSPFDYETILIAIYTYFGASVLGLIFAYNKQKDLQLVKLQNKSLKFREKFSNATLYDSMNVEEKIAKALGSENLRLSETLRDVTKSMQDMIHKVNRGDNMYVQNNMDFGRFDREVATLAIVNSHIQELANRSKHYLHLDVKPMDMQEFVEEIDNASSVFIPGDYSMISHTKESRIKCDNGSIMILFYNILEEINKQNVTNSDLIVDISDTELSYKLSFLPQYEKKIKALRITVSTAIDIYPSLYKNIYTSDLLSPRDIKPLSDLDLPKVESDRILAAHYGVCETVDSLEDGYTIICVIPIDLREVRPAPVDIKSTGRIVNMWPKSKELEDQLKSKIIDIAPNIDIRKINKAIDMIKEYHSEQKRKSGEPFYLHPVEVAKILLDYSQNEDLVLAALLHDTLEDTSLHPMDIKTIFGVRVAELVLGVTKIDFKGIPRVLSEQENLEYLMQADKDVLIIKLSDRLHNMRTIEGHENVEKRRRIAKETLDFFVPIAKSLDLNKIQYELRDLSEKILQEEATGK